MDVVERIRATLEAHPIVLFMKGTPEYPMCEQSARAVEALARAGAVFHAVNVLIDPEVRAVLPRFADQPGFPQLFVQGELFGGSDITVELLESGELARIARDLRGAAA
ncbi:MAG TPA: glutaredoxin domain-containing protein [Rhodanobacteraceae bacterium]|nr:glutaredoxin domain-containing protein [Rhodanobacteraceae bacterium]